MKECLGDILTENGMKRSWRHDVPPSASLARVGHCALESGAQGGVAECHGGVGSLSTTRLSFRHTRSAKKLTGLRKRSLRGYVWLCLRGPISVPLEKTGKQEQ